MSDDTDQTVGQDREPVSLSERFGAGDWSAKFGVSEERLRAAVARIGPMARSIERELRR